METPISSPEVGIVPLEDVDMGVVRFLKKELSNIFKLKFTVFSPLPLPPSSFNSSKNQYFSSPILQLLKEKTSFFKVIGITDRDLYVPGLNFIFGQAELGGRAAIVSIARLKESFYGKEEDLRKLKIRALKECLHELGHTFGLRHCISPGCVMNFSNSIYEVDRKGITFCDSCSRFLHNLKR
ncbi:archaemetzincin family Zn-dependent metalloprotease [Candidatus Calescamantes bacterium]|nr:archaemetzincin family Zn-dependent metalloprotease [Candidatus Calescamantes bacterium]